MTNDEIRNNDKARNSQFALAVFVI